MYINELSCCAMADVDGIQECASPKEALLAICERAILKDRYSKTGGFRNYIQSILLFSGVEEAEDESIYRNGEDKPYDDDDDDFYERGECVKIGYASELAAYITEQKLGAVVAGPQAYNEINHPTHLVQAFLWAPDRKALTDWYTTNYRAK